MGHGKYCLECGQMGCERCEADSPSLTLEGNKSQFSTGETQKDQITALTEEVRLLKQSLKSEREWHLLTLQDGVSQLQLIRQWLNDGGISVAKYFVEQMICREEKVLQSLKKKETYPTLISTPDTTPKPTSSESTSLEMRLLTLLKSDPERELTWTETCVPTTTGGYSHTISILLRKIVPR